MSSVATIKLRTRELGNMLAPNCGWKRQVSAVHAELTRENFDFRLEHLTWNRVRSWFFGMCRRVDYEEMVAVLERTAIEEARREHKQFAAASARMAAALAAEGAALDGRQLAILARISGGPAHL